MPEELYARDASNQLNPITTSNPLPTRRFGVDDAILAETNVTWANSAAVNTEQLAALATMPAVAPLRSRVFVRNPSVVTALTVQAQEQRGARWFTVDEWTVLAAGAHADEQGQTAQQDVRIVSHWPLGTAARLRLRNATVLGAGDGFTGTVEVRRSE